MTLKLFEVRNRHGQFIGAYYGKNEKLVIARAEAELNAGAGAFRKSWTRISLAGAMLSELKLLIPFEDDENKGWSLKIYKGEDDHVFFDLHFNGKAHSTHSAAEPIADFVRGLKLVGIIP